VDQFEAWRAHMEPLVDVALPDDRTPADGFAAEQTAWNLGEAILVYQRASAHRYSRSAAKLKASPIDHWQIDIVRHGRMWTEANRHVTAGESGTVSLRSLGYPFRGRAMDMETATLFMPQDLFADTPAFLGAINNVTLSGNLASLLIGQIDS